MEKVRAGRSILAVENKGTPRILLWVGGLGGGMGTLPIIQTCGSKLLGASCNAFVDNSVLCGGIMVTFILP